MYSVKESVIVNGIEPQQAATGDYTQLFLAKCNPASNECVQSKRLKILHYVLRHHEYNDHQPIAPFHVR